MLQCKGKEIRWSHLIKLYYDNRSKQAPGMALLTQLKYEHIYLTSYSKMRVDLAVQVNNICTFDNYLCALFPRYLVTEYTKLYQLFKAKKLQKLQILQACLINSLIA